MAEVGRGAPAARLWFLAAASFSLYCFAFVRNYSLAEWWNWPQREIGSMAPDGAQGYLIYGLTMGALFALYLLALRAAENARGLGPWIAVIGGAILINAAMLLAYPFTSGDLFEYIIRGRVASEYGGNPFYDTPSLYPGDPFLYYSSWRYWPSAYGPLWELLASSLTSLSGDGVVANAVAFKLAAIAAYAGTAALIGLNLRATRPSWALRGVALFAWNPLVIVETAGNGHNDSLMVLFVAAGAFLVVKRRYTLAAMAMVLGALVKFIPALLLPLVLLAAMRDMHGVRRRLGYLLGIGALGAALTVVFYLPFWEVGSITDLLGVGRRSLLFTTSLPALLWELAAPRLGVVEASRIVSGAALGALVLWMGWSALRGWRSQEREWFARAGSSVFLFYLLVSVLWFFPWYLLWPLALGALLPRGGMQKGVLLFSFSASLKPAIAYFYYVVLAEGEQLTTVGPEWVLTLGTMLLPWAFFLGLALRAGGRRAAEAPPGGQARAADG